MGVAGAPASQARITINSASQGNVTLKRCKSSKVSSNASREEQTAMGEDAPVGTTRKPGAHAITLEIIDSQGKPEVDWEYLEESGEVFTLTRGLVGGRRLQYLEAVVSKTDLDDDSEGKHSGTVEILAMRRKRL